MTTDLSDDEMARIRAALEAVPAVEKAVLFGSRAMGLARSNSDVDILLYGDALQTRDVLRVASLLDATTLPYQFDLIRHDENNASLLEHVREYGKVIFQRQEMTSLSKTSRKSAGIASEWENKELSELSLDVAYGYTESASTANVGPHFLRITDIQNGTVNWASVPYCPITPDNHKKYKLHPGDIVVARTGNSTGENFLYHDKEDAVFASYLIRFRINQKKADPKFVWYNLRSSAWWDFINSSKTGSAQAGANARVLGRFPISCPPLPEQRAIAHILGTLDDKIELNRRMNETLESMARALFKAWFVDFEPVRAKMTGRWRRGQSLPGLPAHIYDLFPDRLVESELGVIPEEWKIGALGDVAEHPRRSVQPGEIIQGTPYIALEHMPKRCITLAEWDIANGLESNKYLFKHGEILFGKLRPYFHKVGIAPLDGICSTDIVVIAPKSSEWLSFTLTHVSSDEFVEYTNAGSTGTKMPRTSWSEMSRYTVILPPKVVSAAFDHYLRPVVEEIIAKIHESKTLAQLRDTLLPKLISGELHTKNVNGFIEETIYD